MAQLRSPNLPGMKERMQTIRSRNMPPNRTQSDNLRMRRYRPGPSLVSVAKTAYFWRKKRRGNRDFRDLARLSRCAQTIAVMDLGIELEECAVRKCVGLTGEREKRKGTVTRLLRLGDDRFDSIAAILIRLFASTAAPTHNSKTLAPSARQALHATTRNSTEMRPRCRSKAFVLS